jgi:chromosomal replication initiator protein
MSQDSEELWAQCLVSIEQRLRPQSFNTWFRPTTVRRFDADRLEIEVSSTYFADWVESNYLSLINGIVLEVTQLQPKISFIVSEKDHSSVPADTNRPEPTSDQDLDAEQLELPHLQPAPITTGGVSSSLNERYTFDTFVIGEFNRFAHAAAWAVAKSPGKTQFNPLVLYGGVGLGKTHLLQAIGHDALDRKAANRVTYVASEKFMSDFIEAIRNRNTAEFQRRYRSADILLVDDIQFLLKGEQTRNEFFHTFNALHQNGKQIVMTCDSPPGQLEGLEERLISRFQWGLVTGIDAPDLEARIAILQQKAELNNILLADEVAIFLANYVSSNIRELEGALIHLMAYCSVNHAELTIEAARRIALERGPSQSAELSIESIQQQVARHFDLTPELLIGRTRKQEVSQARQIAMFLAKRFTRNPLKMIGLHFGNRDHTTVIHAVQTVEAKCKADPSFAITVERLSESIQKKYALG